MSDPYRELARGIKNMAKNQSKNAVLGLHAELGTITVTGLKLDRFKYELKDYLIADYLTLDITPGDRVLAVPVNVGQDYVVVARVVANG